MIGNDDGYVSRIFLRKENGMSKKDSPKLRRDSHHGGWVLLPNQPEREQLLDLPRNEWPDGGNAFCRPEEAGAHSIWQRDAHLPDGKTARVKVIANRYAMYRIEGNEDREGDGMYDLMRNVGAHEIVVESESRQDTLSSMSPHHFAVVLRALKERILDLHNDHRLKSFSIFREWQCGNAHHDFHPQSQLVASAIIPLGLKNELDSAWDYYDYKERCIFCDMLRQELADEKRLVEVTEDFAAYCPFASRHPFEIHLFPRAHNAWFSEESTDRFTPLAEMIRNMAVRLDQAIPGWRVLMAVHAAPVKDRRQQPLYRIPNYYHWHIEFLPQPPGYIDWYARTGTHIEYTPPEKAAEFLRKLDISSPWG